ncbi:MAG: MgtC/SapB family protein [Salinibacter sp.]|uniref:MgtC/SapB family protein n=1 Tax=Salinibacter sp. TaxID=2065818 RepID=UPI0035D4438E
MEPNLTQLAYRFGTALVLGLFMGLQREYAYRRRGDEGGELMAGARTFPIIALLGAASALSATELEGGGPFAAALFAVGLLLAIAHFRQAQERDTGLTTEMAALVAFFTGALCYWGHIRLGAALGVGTAVLLSLKVQTRALARTLDREDIVATLKFAVITVIVLPLLPREGHGPAPFDVLVPYNVWLMVVLISGISFLGYVLIKWVGPRRGVGLTGILGGLASSTAVTLSVAERSRDTEGLDRPFALAVLLAWAIMFARVIVEVAVVSPPLLATVWLPILGVGAASLAYCGYLYRVQPLGESDEPQTVRNPFRLVPAITFGVLYAAILVLSNWAQSYLGDAGVYLSSLVAGLADVDAITLSMARLHESGDLSAATATQAIVIAAAANTVLKGGIVALTGTSGLRRAVVPGLLLIVGASVGAVLLV